MRKWISIFVMAAFVLTTIMPASSHASMHSGIAAPSATQVENHSDGHLNHHHEAKLASAVQGDKPCCDHANKKPCCGKGKMCCKDMCKCPGGNCNGGIAKVFPNGSGDLRLLASSQSSFGFSEEFIESAYLSRLKRPPKA